MDFNKTCFARPPHCFCKVAWDDRPAAQTKLKSLNNCLEKYVMVKYKPLNLPKTCLTFLIILLKSSYTFSTTDNV